MQIEFDEWKKLDIRVGHVLEAEKIPKTEKLYKMQVDIGERKIQVVTSLVDFYTEEELRGRKIIVLVNLKPTKFHGEISEGMLLCAENEKDCVLLTTEKDVEAGTHIT